MENNIEDKTINFMEEKMNNTNIIINNTNKMNFNNINIKNIFFQNLIPQKIISEIFESKNENCEFKDEQEYYKIEKGKNFIFNDKIYKYIIELCIKSIDFSLKSKQENIKEIQAKNIIKYLNKLIKAEWFILICDLNEHNNFEFSYSELNKEDIFIFEYKKYKIYIYLLFLKLNTNFDFEIPNQINNKEQEKSEKIFIHQEEINDNEIKDFEISKINDKIDENNNIIINENNIINNENNKISKETDIKSEKKNVNFLENIKKFLENNIKKTKLTEEINEKKENCLNNKENNDKNIKENEKLNDDFNENIEVIDEINEKMTIKEEKDNNDIKINRIKDEEIADKNEQKEEKDDIKENKDELKNNNNFIDIEEKDKNIDINIKEEKTDFNKNIKENINDKNENITDELNNEKNYKYSINTYNYKFTNRRQYYKNKNKLKDDIIYNDMKLERKEKLKERRVNTEDNNILFIYNKPNKEDNENLNKPIDLLEPNNLYYLRQDIKINNEEIQKDNQLYNNIQKKIKRMLVNTKIPIFNFDNYKIIKTIGEGTYGKLYYVINNITKKSYAMKELIASDINYFYQCLNTLGINHHNKHQNILDIYGIYVIILDEKNFLIYALMDLAEGDWEKEIRRRKELYKFYKEEELILILKQLVSALSFLQKRNIAHRDIKLENILLFPNEMKDKNMFEFDKIYKIGDFGEAKNKIKYSVILNIIRGTDYYMSPELLEGVNKQKDFIKNNPHKSDVFSLGCCMMIASTLNYEIIHDIRTPKTQDELNKIIKSVLEKRYSKKYSDLIIKMLINDENKRIDFINLERIIKRKYL